MNAPIVITPPPGSDRHFEVLGKSQAAVLRSGLVTLQPGENVGSHSTEDHEELIVILAGNGEIEAGNLGRKKISMGQVAYNPPQTRHDVFNVGQTPLRYLYVVAKTGTI